MNPYVAIMVAAFAEQIGKNAANKLFESLFPSNERESEKNFEELLDAIGKIVRMELQKQHRKESVNGLISAKTSFRTYSVNPEKNLHILKTLHTKTQDIIEHLNDYKVEAFYHCIDAHKLRIKVELEFHRLYGKSDIKALVSDFAKFFNGSYSKWKDAVEDDFGSIHKHLSWSEGKEGNIRSYNTIVFFRHKGDTVKKIKNTHRSINEARNQITDSVKECAKLRAKMIENETQKVWNKNYNAFKDLFIALEKFNPNISFKAKLN